MNPPYFFAPFIIGKKNNLIDLGFRTQQIVLFLWNRGIGSCYIGCAHRQNQVKKLLKFPDGCNIISFVIFGLPDTNQSLRLYQKLALIFTRSKKRFSFEELFLGNPLPKNISKSNIIMKILEAGRLSPSATNAQPWRFEIKDEKFIIYAHQKKVANIFDLEQGYSLHDTGICMSNMSQAAEALGTEIHWNWINSNMDNNSMNEINIPAAYFYLDEIRSK